MINKILKIVKLYFSFNVNSKKRLIILFIMALLKTLSILLIPLTTASIVEFATSDNFEKAYLYGLLFLSSGVFYILMNHLYYVAKKKHFLYSHNQLQDNVINKISNYDDNFQKKLSPNLIINSTSKDINQIVLIPVQLFDIITEVISIVITIIILFSVNIYIGLVSLILISLSLCLLNKNILKKEWFLAKQRNHQDNIGGLMKQTVEGNIEIKSFNIKQDINKHLKGHLNSWNDMYKKNRKHHINIFVFNPMILAIGKILLYVISAILILLEHYDVATLVLVLGYYETNEGSFGKLHLHIDELIANAVRVERITKILKYKNTETPEFGDLEKDDITGEIAFKKVSFNYDGKEILKNVSFKIEPKSLTFIVGQSGSGKSTIFKLLLRLQKVNKGIITIDNENIYNYTKDVYSKNISIVTKKPFIFDVSIKENLGLVDSSYENQINACKLIGIHDTITKLDKGYNTPLKDLEDINEGLKQEIAIARSILTKAEILLFDEVDANLDLDTSEKIINIFNKLKETHTILFITHNHLLINKEDNVVVVSNKKVVGHDKHRKLMKNNKHYRELQKQ